MIKTHHKAILIMIFTSLLAGCATTTVQDTEGENAPKITTIATAPLAPTEINDVMNSNDRRKLQQLVTSAKEKQKTSWQGAKAYQFESLKIYVNTEGHACRQYKFSADLGTFFHSEKEAVLTACRTDEGGWEIRN